ncbi:MAG: HAMP domain-containing histidine kinase [Clostridia bacterium]|nr:HAMP domain-containing histidine kinase [Clostridia bacterium]
MRKLSITMKLTLWYGIFMLLSIVLTWYVFKRTATVAAERYYRDELAQAVSLAIENASYSDGYLEFEEMPDAMEHVHLSYFAEDGALLYGHICSEEVHAPGKYFMDYDEHERHRYIYDEAFELEGYGFILIRASISMQDAESIRDLLSASILFIIPALLLVSLAGGFILSRRAMHPIKRITETAQNIAVGADLEKRISISHPSDELSELSSVINGMLSRLERAFAREKRFTGDVSHELRTPVAAVLSLSEGALMEGANDADKTLALWKIREKSLEMSRMIKNLLLLARMDAGKCDLQREKTDLSEIAEAVFSEAHERFKDKEIAAYVNLEPAECRCDPMLTALLIMNLTENAFRYTKSGGEIKLMTLHAPKGAIFMIENRGAGLSPGEDKIIFDRFYRANKSRSDGGNGLGLSIAKAIADAHGAYLTCESEENAFVRFTLIVP